MQNPEHLSAGTWFLLPSGEACGVTKVRKRDVFTADYAD
jgi:hypothetical protein